MPSQNELIGRMRLQRGAEHLHDLGPRAFAEFLAEIAATIGGRSSIMGSLAEYERRLTSVTLNAAGGDRFPARILNAAP
jgi:hypothetical protein